MYLYGKLIKWVLPFFTSVLIVFLVKKETAFADVGAIFFRLFLAIVLTSIITVLIDCSRIIQFIFCLLSAILIGALLGSEVVGWIKTKVTIPESTFWLFTVEDWIFFGITLIFTIILTIAGMKGTSEC